MRIGLGIGIPRFNMRAGGGVVNPLLTNLRCHWLAANANLEVPAGRAFTPNGGATFLAANPFWGTTLPSPAAYFTGGTQYFSATNAVLPEASFPAGSKRTIAILLNHGDTTLTGAFCSKGTGATSEYQISHLANTGAYANFFDGIGNALTTVGDYGAGSTGPLDNNNYYLCFLSFDPTVGATGTTYIQGCEFDGPNSGSAVLNLNRGAQNLTAFVPGSAAGPTQIWRHNSNNPTTGAVLFWASWDRILSAQERQNILDNIRVYGVAPLTMPQALTQTPTPLSGPVTA